MHLPEPSLLAFLTQTRFDAFGVVVAVLGGGTYLAGVAALRARGDRWPVGRSVAHAAAIALILAVTCGGIGVYAHALFSAHMVQHMTLNMLVPLLLAAGAPVTLLLRALPARGRALVLAGLRSPVARAVSHPLVVTGVFVLSLYALYFTPLFEFLMRAPWGHALMLAHFLISGLAFFWLILGIDPNPRAPAPVARLPLLLAVMLGHTLFAVVLVFGSRPIAGSYYDDMQSSSPWSVPLLPDQALAGGIAWTLGELVTVGVLAALLVRWFRAAERADRARARERRRRAQARAAGASAPPGGG